MKTAIRQEATGNSKKAKVIGLAGFALCALLVTLCASVQAQQLRRVPRIGFLSSRSPDAEKSRLAAFQQGLQKLGYSAGKNILIEQRYAAGKFDRLPDLAAELVGLKVDVLVTTGTPAAHAAKNATSTIPIVIGNAGDPVGTGLVASLARPGGNVTGLSVLNTELSGKRLELLKEVVPTASRVAVLLNPANSINPLQLKEIQSAAPALGVTLHSLEVTGTDDIDRAFTAMKKERTGGLIVLGDPLLETHRTRIAELAVKSQLPAIYSLAPYVEAGGLMSYGTNFDDLYRRAATYVDKILKGSKPADLPVEQPTKFEFVINLKAAKQIGLTIPPNVLARADRVIR
jgi:putative tryptophan/tyrosine transport system substrate-binding protein